MKNKKKIYKEIRSWINALQHLIVALPSTVLVALLTGFPVSTTLFCCGLANLAFCIITKKKVPLIWGASFAFIPSISSITGAGYGEIAGDSGIASALIGILSTGVVLIIVGGIVRFFGNKIISKLIPPVISGSIAIVIGVSLSTTAVKNLFASVADPVENNISVFIGLFTLLFAICLSICKHPILNRFSIIISVAVGCVIAAVCSAFGFNLFALSPEQFRQGIFQIPHFVFPWQTQASLLPKAILSVLPVSIILLPETIAHVFQADLTVSHLENKDSGINNALGDAIIGNGFAECLCAAMGGSGVTSYGENLSVMSLSKDRSIKTIVRVGILFIPIAFFSPLCNFFYSVPTCITGAISIYLFGMIICQGIGVLFNNKVDLFDPKNLSVISSILIIGIGGLLGFSDGNIVVFGVSLPAVAVASLVGILVHSMCNIKSIFHRI